MRLDGDALVICAPLGLGDLFEPFWRFDEGGYASREQFDRRTRRKRITERWPSVQAVSAPPGA